MELRELWQFARQRLRKLAAEFCGDEVPAAVTADDAAARILEGVTVLRAAIRQVRDGGIQEHFELVRDCLVDLALEFLPEPTGQGERKDNCDG